ncbi:MAG: ABC transporter permease [Actinobacteria bacterium]|jgi:ABC-2 type transport system permease protein|nr:ABC transporter permease [Actinomycetota bacterium]
MSATDLSASPSAPARSRTVVASLRLLRSELRIIAGRRRNQAGILVLASVPVLIAVALKFSQPREGRGPDFISSATSNGIFVSLTALSIEIALFLPLAVAALAGDTIAGEANIGTLRYLLTVPVDRTRLLAVKFVSLVLGACFGVLVVAVTGVIVGGALFGLGPTTLLSGSQIGLADALARLALAVLYLSAGLAGLAAIGLFISTLTEQPIGAMIAITVVSTAMWILDGIPQLEWLQPWLLVHYWTAFSDAFRDPIFYEQMRQGLLVALGYVVVFVSLAWARFTQKDITS